MDWAKTTARRDENQLNFVIWWIVYLRFYGDCLCYTQIISVCSLYRVNSIVFDVYIMNVYCSFDCAANNISFCDMDKWCIAMGIYDTNIICYLRVYIFARYMPGVSGEKASQYWTRKYFVIWRHQGITQTNVDFSLVRFCGFHSNAISPDHSEHPKVYSV